jgi:cytochrome c-type biogenesis protein CcmH
MKKFLIAAFFFLVASAGLRAAPSLAQSVSPEMDDDVRSVAKMLNCPTCSGRNLADCPTETCLQWKGEIRAQLDAGKSTQEVVNYFQDRFGTTVLQEPPKAGNTLILWLAPIGAALMLIGGGIVVVQRLSARAKSTPAAAAVATSNDPYARRIEEEVQAGL